MGLCGAGTCAELADVLAKRVLRAADACERSASDGSASDWGAPRHSAQRDSRAGALSARDPGRQKNERAHWAHWVGSAYHSISLLRLGRCFLSRPQRAGACNPHEVSAQASEQPHTSPNGRRGLDDGPIGCGIPGVVGAPRVCAPGVAACPACTCRATKENDLCSSFPLRRGI